MVCRSVCQSIGQDREPCKSSGTDRADAVQNVDSDGEHALNRDADVPTVIRGTLGVSDRWKSIVKHRILGVR